MGKKIIAPIFWSLGPKIICFQEYWKLKNAHLISIKY